MEVAVSALLSAIHVLTLALGLGAVVARGRALAAPLDESGWRRLLIADNLWGLAAALWIASGLGRVFFGGKEPAFYWGNGLFWLKLTLFALRAGLRARAGADGDVYPRAIGAPQTRAYAAVPGRDLSPHQRDRNGVGNRHRVCRRVHGARRVDGLTQRGVICVRCGRTPESGLGQQARTAPAR